MAYSIKSLLKMRILIPRIHLKIRQAQWLLVMTDSH